MFRCLTSARSRCLSPWNPLPDPQRLATATSIALVATGSLLIELRRRVEDFGWDFAYALSPGFENNEGGYGELTWAIEADKIDVSHSNRYIETETTEHEGL